MDEDILDFNFWPSFADLMLALVLVLVLLLALVAAVITRGTVNLEQVEKNQAQVVRTIASSYGTTPKELLKNTYGISINHSENYDIEISNKPPLQRITFSDHILFSPDDYQVNQKGQEVLKTVGAALKQQLPFIREIQIQGHADTDRTTRYPSNIHLAALRAIEVFNYLQNTEGIDPAAHLMSATSFGEFKPVQRSEDDEGFSRDQLQRDNSSVELKGKNRRIELLLFYRQ